MKLFPFAIFKVEGESMLPEFRPGDFVIVYQWASLWGKPRLRDTIVFCDPRANSRILIKRIVRIRTDNAEVAGDNKQNSTDSRTFGGVPRSLFLGKALLRIGKNKAEK